MTHRLRHLPSSSLSCSSVISGTQSSRKSSKAQPLPFDFGFWCMFWIMLNCLGLPCVAKRTQILYSISWFSCSISSSAKWSALSTRRTMLQSSVIPGFFTVSRFRFCFSVTTNYAVCSVQISVTSVLCRHICTRNWPLWQSVDSPFLMYFIFPLILLGTPFSGRCVPQTQVFFSPNSISLSWTLIVSVLLQVVSFIEKLFIQKL